MTTQTTSKLDNAIAKYQKALEAKQAKKAKKLADLKTTIENIENEVSGLSTEENNLFTLERMSDEANYLKSVDPSTCEYLSFSHGTEFTTSFMSDSTKDAFKNFCGLLAADYKAEQKRLASEMGLIQYDV